MISFKLFEFGGFSFYDFFTLVVFICLDEGQYLPFAASTIDLKSEAVIWILCSVVSVKRFPHFLVLVQWKIEVSGNFHKQHKLIRVEMFSTFQKYFLN
ncbi:unnamed protein product [Camellia sinensis]